MQGAQRARLAAGYVHRSVALPVTFKWLHVWAQRSEVASSFEGLNGTSKFGGSKSLPVTSQKNNGKIMALD